MATRVNFLPWRQRRRRRFWRFWCLLFAGSALVMCLLALSLHGLIAADRLALRAVQDANTRLLREFAEHRLRLDLRQKQAEAILRRQQQREQTARWQPILLAIAARLPARIWLTQLEFRQDILMLTGYGLSVSDLRQMDAALGNISGLRNGTAGKTHRDTQGRWQFYYQLNREPEYVATP